MRVLVIGNGGREHTLVWKLRQDKRIKEIYVAPGNAGTDELAINIDINSSDINGLVRLVRDKGIDLTFVGPEASLVAGIVDHFQSEGLKIFGPCKDAAQLEGSKVFAKNLMKKYGIPTADYRSFNNPEPAIEYIKEKGTPIVIKAEGLAAGKGVIIASSEEEAINVVKEILIDNKFGQAGEQIVIEEYLDGEEATVLAFTDGKTIIPMLPSQDHKQVYDQDQGPNTGGMGAYAPAPLVAGKMMHIQQEILQPTINALRNEGIDYRGVIYCGLMIKGESIKVLEYNVRFGDPEAQVVLPLLKTDLIDIAEAVIAGKLKDIKIDWSNQASVCVIMASGGYPVKYNSGEVITGLEEVKNSQGIIVFHAGTEKKGELLVTAGGRVLGITAIDNDLKSAIDRAYHAVEKIDFAGAHYRKDIGQKALRAKER